MSGNRNKWRRKSDGVIVSTVDWNGNDVLVTREDNGRTYWATWGGLRRKYEQLENTGGTD